MRRTVSALIILLGFWWGLSALLSVPFLPDPWSVLAAMITEMTAGELLRHLLISLYRVLAALVSAFIPALLLGILAGVHRASDRILSPFMYILFPIPKVALLPLILLLFGLGDGAKIFLVALILFFQFFINIRDESNRISKTYYVSLTTLGGKRRHTLIHIILPSILPRIFSSLRLTLGTAIAVLFMAETFATRTGIGWYIMDGWARLDYIDMYAGISGLSLAGLLLFGLIDIAEKRFCRWQQ